MKAWNGLDSGLWKSWQRPGPPSVEIYRVVWSKAKTLLDLKWERRSLQCWQMSPGDYAQQRRVPRYPFAAPAAVLPETGTPVGGNIKELSLYGCYMDATSTLSPRSKVLVKIFMPGEYFEANATVAYANPALGLGLVFRDVKPHFRTVLRKWLLMAMQFSQPTTLQGVEPGESIEGELGGEQEEPTSRAEKDRTGEK
jgi:hypothetical protein